ncbi:MAG: hypothetical protein JNN30_21115 [Rhodanobacteraceae bacterium]|nr:hypothetical protein [Rhodanobacteraceae bacterium]
MKSFFKREWVLDDYPVSVTQQENSDGDLSVHDWVARVEGWKIVGTGATEADARLDLLSHFEAYKSKNPLPRPGARVPISFAAATELDRHGDFAYEFIEATVGVRPLFLSDESSLSDFDGIVPMQEVHAKILEKFGVDSTDLETESLWKLLDKVVDARASGDEQG